MVRNLGCKGCVRLLYEVPQADLVLDKLARTEVFFHLVIEGKGGDGENQNEGKPLSESCSHLSSAPRSHAPSSCCTCRQKKCRKTKAMLPQICFGIITKMQEKPPIKHCDVTWFSFNLIQVGPFVRVLNALS